MGPLGKFGVVDRDRDPVALLDLVVGDVVGGDQPSQAGQEDGAEFSPVLGVVGITDEVEDGTQVAFS
jgi:hypothetical protein